MTERKPDELRPQRTSARILFRKKLKSMSNTSLPRAPTDDDSDDKIISPIDYENPEHKLRFLKRLGLKPIISAFQHQESQPDVVSGQNNTEPSKNLPFSSSSSSSEASGSDSDIGDLDLELVFCPLDIPEIYEEITKKPFPKYLYEKSTCNNHNCCACASTPDIDHNSFTSESSSVQTISSPLSPINTHVACSSSSNESSSSSSSATAAAAAAVSVGEKSSIHRPNTPAPIISIPQPSSTCNKEEDDDDCIILGQIFSKYIEKPVVLKTVQNNNPIIIKQLGNKKQNRKRRKSKRDKRFSKIIIHDQDFDDTIKASCCDDRWDKIYFQRTFDDPNSTLKVVKRRIWMVDSKLEYVED